MKLKNSFTIWLFCLLAMVGSNMVALADDATEYSWLTVNFVLQNGTEVGTAYSGQFQAGEEYPEETVSYPRFPKYSGYMPTLPVAPTAGGLDFDYQDGDYEFTYSFDGSQIAGNIDIDIVFVPILNVYKAEYYHQSLEDDTQFDKAATETFSGMTGDTVDSDTVANRHSAPGFVMREFTAPTIAADGSTVVKVFYDRLYYQLSFETNGAVESTATQYLAYGATVGTVATPTKPGYTFTGWSPSVPSTMPAENTTCTAQWALASDNANVSVIVWGENSNDDSYAYIATSTVSAPVGETYTLDQIYTCGKTEHTHSESCGLNCTHVHNVLCYGATSETPSSPSDSYISTFGNLSGGLVSGRIYRRNSSYWLYYNNKWYPSNADAVSTQIDSYESWSFIVTVTYYVYNAKPVDQMCKHATHDDSCYACGLEEHTHTNSCASSMIDLNLYTLNSEKTETSTTVEADGTSVLNVYYDRKEFTLTMNYNYSNSTYRSSGTITDKWGANIADDWNNMSDLAGNSKWSRDNDGDDPWTEFLQIMPTENRTYYMASTSGSDQTASYYIQSLDNPQNYDLMTTVTIRSSRTVQQSIEDRFDLEGFTYKSGYSSGSNYGGAKFYYDRNSYDLVLNNGKENIQSISVKFEKSLGTVGEYTAYSASNPPEHPDTIPSSYLFTGWSLAPNGIPDDSIDDITMPPSNLILYACWEKPEYDILAYEAKGDSSTYFDETVIYGNKIDGLEDPTKEGYEFIGWFYVDGNGTEHAFNPGTMYVYGDMALYAKWRNLATANYTVNFVEKDTGTVLAAPQTGTATVDTSFSVTPKAISGYFPTLADTTIDMGADKPHTATFEYIKVNNVPYMVKYVDENGTNLIDPKTVSENSLDVVTEKYVPITDYIVNEAFQTRYLVVSNSNPQPSDNVITFVYTYNTTDIMITVEYFINTDLTGTNASYQRYSYEQEVRTYHANEAVTIEPQEISNYERNTELGTATTQNMPSPKADMVFEYYYDPKVVTVTYRDGVTEGDDGILQQTKTLIWSTTPAYTGSTPIHPENPADYVFDAFEDEDGNALPATIEDEDITFYAKWAGLFHVHHCTGEAPDDSDTVEDIRVDAVTEEYFDVTSAIDDDIYGGISDGYLYGGLWADAEGSKLLSYDADDVCGVELEPSTGLHYYVREISNGFLTPRTLSVRVSGVYSHVIVSAIDDPANYVDVGFDIVKANGNEVTLYPDAYDALKIIYQNKSTKQYTANDVFSGLSGKMLCSDTPADTSSLTFKAFFATQDNVKVYGVKTRTLSYNSAADSVKTDTDEVLPCTKYDTTDESGETNETVRMALTVSPSFVLGSNDVPEATIIINVEDRATSMTVPAGTDCRDRICNPSLTGYVFAGWFKDEACTRPANLSNVTEDMEIYAAFMKDGYLQIAELPVSTGSDIQRVRLVAAVDTVLTSACGFIVSDENGSREIPSSDFYDSIEGFKAADLFDGTDEFASLICHDLTVPSGESTITVTPYWIPLTGAKVNGTTITINGK